MSKSLNELLSDWLDDPMSESIAHCELLEEASCDEVAESLLIHGLLSNMSQDGNEESERIKTLMQAIEAEKQSSNESLRLPQSQTKHTRRMAILTSTFTLVAAAIVVAVLLGPQQSVSAAMSLEMLLEAAAQPNDSTYEIRVLEEYPRDKRPRHLSEEVWNRKSKEQIDGAKLYVRGPDKYVLVRILRDGRQRLTGCDGVRSWAFREDGPVHVSSDLHRFRGGIPGHQQDLPFINLHSHLSQLQTGYDIKLGSEHSETLDGTAFSRLVGSRKSRDVRGPKRIDIWFDSERGTVHRMVLDGLPRGRGGPKSVSLELIDQTDLGSNFFSHRAHHEPGRRVRHEDGNQ